MSNPTAADAAHAVQAGVHALLTGDAELMALIDGVYDEVPEPAPYPYLTIRDSMSTPHGTHSGYGEQVTITVHTWTQYAGNAAGDEIAARVHALLHQQHAALSPLVDGHTVYIVRREFRQSLNDPQPGIRHRVDRYRIYVSQDMEA